MFQRQRGQLAVDAVIVGGGLTGCTTAYAFAAAGLRVALIEAERLGRGASGCSTGWLGDDPGASFVEATKSLGLRRSRWAWQAWRRSALDFAALTRRLKIRCHLQPASTVAVATTPEQASRLQREFKARRAAGLDLSAPPRSSVAAETALSVSAAFKSRSGATVDPYRLVVGLARAAAERGALLFERSLVRRIVFEPKRVVVTTAAGTVWADRVVVATGTPTTLFPSLVRHFRIRSSFLALTESLPGRMRAGFAGRTSVVRDSAAPPHVIRWVDDRLLVSGADSGVVSSRVRDRTIVQRTGQLMYELSTMYPDISGIPPAYGWDASFGCTADGLPYIGPHRNFPRHLFALGESSHGITGAYLASRVLLRHFLEDLEPTDSVFAFTRR